MTKFSVTQNGTPLSETKYTWDDASKTFSTTERKLVLDFSGINGCTFKAGSYCTFDTGSSCTFDTSFNCIFKTKSDCTFDTGSDCNFTTGTNCNFKTDWSCTFNTGSDCTFDTGSYITFNTGSDCTFNTGSDCTFKTGTNGVIVRRDGFEVITLDKKVNHIKLNEYKGYEVLEDTHTIIVDGKEVELSSNGYNQIKEFLKQHTEKKSNATFKTYKVWVSL